MSSVRCCLLLLLWCVSAAAGELAPAVQESRSVTLGPYVYDGAGNITSIGGMTPSAFGYDRAGRVTSATVGPYVQSYTYDAYGNLRGINTSAPGAAPACYPGVTCGASNIAVDPQTNRVTAVNNIPATYDARGNLTAGGEQEYSYDDVGMLTHERRGTTHREYVYTPGDERIAVVVNGSWSWSVRDEAGRVLRRFRSSDGPGGAGTDGWVWEEDLIYRGDRLLASETPAGRHHLLLDHLGTPRLIVDDLGRRVGEHAYLPFGAEITWTGRFIEQPESTRKFTGHERDFQTSGSGIIADANTLDYMHARFYNPTTGRFLSVDPVLAVQRAMHNPQGWNRYSYVQNNPINRIDPDGRLDGNSDDSARQLFPNDRAAQLAFDQGVAEGTAKLSAAFLLALVPGPEDIALGWLGAVKGVRAGGRFISRLFGAADDLPSAGSIRNVNPTGGGQNCVNCAIATDAMLAGRPASALPGGKTPLSVIENHFGSKFASMGSQGAIQNAMLKAGNGARGIVYTGPRGPGTGHVFNVVNQNGVVRFLDGQTGKAAQFDPAWTDIRMIRTN